MKVFDLIGTVVVNVIKSITTVINLITDSVKKSLNDVRAKTKSLTNTRIESRISSSNQTLKTDENGRLRIESVLTSKPRSRGRTSRKRRLVSRRRTPSTRNRATGTNPKKRKRKQS